jgi:hypothetical protein
MSARFTGRSSWQEEKAMTTTDAQVLIQRLIEESEANEELFNRLKRRTEELAIALDGARMGVHITNGHELDPRICDELPCRIWRALTSPAPSAPLTEEDTDGG